MSLIDITCPSCGFSRQVPTDKVPPKACTVTCPKCKTAFSFSRPLPESLSPAAETAASNSAPLPLQQSRPAATQETVQPASTAAATADTPDGALKPPRPRRERPAPRKVLPDIGTLFSESWQMFQRRFATLIGLYLLTIAAFLIPPALLIGAAILTGAGKGGAVFIILGIIGALAGIYFGFRCFGGFLCAVIDDQLAFKDALEKGKGLILPLIWVGFLTGFIISGGFLLLIIPGIIFIVWFFFAQFIMIEEDLRGMGALLKSREYVRGEWFNVALRLLLVWTASVLLGMIPLAGPILGIVFLPFFMIFHYLIYRDLRNLKGDIPYSCSRIDLLKWPAVALAGYILVPALLLTIVGGAAMGKLRQLSPAGITIKSGTTGDAASSQGLRIINFPPKEQLNSPSLGADSGAPPPQAQESSQLQPASREETPKDIHFFIYAVNFTGTVRANGTTVKEIEGKPDMQYNYNFGGNGLKYGENRIDLDYSEVPAHQESLLEVKIRVSRNSPGKVREILGEWRMNEKGTGTKSYTFDIPK